MIKNKQKLCKKTFAIFATLFATLTLFFIIKPTDTIVSASSTDASYNVTNFNPLTGATFAIRNQTTTITQNMVDLPFLRLNNNAITTNSYTVGYSDYGASAGGYQFFANYTSAPIGVLYSFSSNNIWLPSEFISELSILDLFKYSHELQGGWSIRYQVEVEYLDSYLDIQTLVYLSNNLSSISASGTFTDFVSAYPAPYRVNIEGTNYSYLKRLRISAITNLNGGGSIKGGFNYRTPEMNVSYLTFVDNQTACVTSLVTALQQDINWFDSIVTTVNSLLQIQVLPNFRILDILIIAVTIPLTIWLLKAWLGG